jgi:hypothetical protein
MMTEAEIKELVLRLLENYLTKQEFLKFVEQLNKQRYQD